MRGSVVALLAVLLAFALAPAILAEPLPALEALEPLVGEGPELLAASPTVTATSPSRRRPRRLSPTGR